MQKLVWRVKFIADFGDEAVETEVQVARIERDDFAVPETLGLSLAEGKRLTAAIQREHGDPFGPGSIRIATEAAVGVFALRVTSLVARHSRACLRMKSSKRTERPRGGPTPQLGALQLL